MELKESSKSVHTIHFFTSPNLKEWTFASKTEGFFECPDLFEMPVDGDSSQKKWVLTAASSEYRVGTFDGVSFNAETPKLPGQRGQGFYAAQTFSDIPTHDGRRICIGWFQTETRGMSFNQSMTIPLELRLTTTKAGPRLTYTPVKELPALRVKTHRMEAVSLSPGADNPLSAIKGKLLEIHAEFEPGDATEIAWHVRGATIVYDVLQQELIVNGQRSTGSTALANSDCGFFAT